MATLSFPSPTQLKNISDPSVSSDAATKSYVDSQITGGGAVAAAMCAAAIGCNAWAKDEGLVN